MLHKKDWNLNDITDITETFGVILKDTQGTFPDDMKQIIAEYILEAPRQIEQFVDCSNVVSTATAAIVTLASLVLTEAVLKRNEQIENEW